MKFHGTIEVRRYEDRYNPEKTEVWADYFEAETVQSAKSFLTRKANTSELFSYIQSWDDKKCVYTGKDIRWKPWSPEGKYTQDDGVEVAFSSRHSDREFGEYISVPGYKHGKSVEYRVDITLRWRR